MANSYAKEWKKLRRKLEQQGWRIEERKAGHIVAFAPNGVDIVTIAKTPSDRRSWENMQALLRRAGADV